MSSARPILVFLIRKFDLIASSLLSQSSNMLNQARLKVLKARDDYVSNVLEETKRQLITISKDSQRYPKILEGLIAQVSRKLSKSRGLE